MGCAQSSATDAVHDTRAGDPNLVSKQYGPPSSHQPAVRMTSVGSPGGPMLSPGLVNGVPPHVPPSIPPPLPEERGQQYISRFAYQARTSEDLSFEKGEKLRVRDMFLIVKFKC